MHVHVDPDRCQGHARCWDVCPEVFTLDDEGHASATTAAVSPELEADVREAAALCPERAITVE
ncbi:MAG TPA: ferredoxin [Acidimicrobiales bacterium]